MDWFQIGKEVCQGCMLSPCLFNWYAQNIMWNAGWGEAQAGIKISCRNNNSLRYTDDTILMEEREEELRASWWKWKRRVKSCLKTQHSKNEVYGIQYYHFMKTDGETLKIVTYFSFLGSKITADGNWSHKILKKKKKLLLWKKSCDHPRKQRYYFADKTLYSQSYSFSSSHVLMC